MSCADISTDEVLKIAKGVAQRYAARVFWAREHVGDMTSEASIAVLMARRTFDAQVGVPFSKYARRAATLRVRDYLWRESSPASGGLHDPHANIAGRHRTQLTKLTELGCAGENSPGDRELLWSELVGDGRDVNDELDSCARRLAVRDRVRALAARTKDGELAEQVMIRGRSSGEVMREKPGKNVYRAVELVRRKARQDPDLYELWADSAS